jgi:hypothetical protein
MHQPVTGVGRHEDVHAGLINVLPFILYDLILADYYAGEMASTGQTSTQVPQSVHFTGSITNISSPSDIASSGHSGSQAPQLMHSSLITWAIFFLLV